MGKWDNETRIETTVKGIEMFMDELGGGDKRRENLEWQQCSR